MNRLRDIQTHSTSLELEGTWITAIWGRCDYLADQLLPEQTCHQDAADAFKAFRLALPDIQSDADYGLKTAREAAADHQTASAALHGIDVRNAAADQAADECAPADPATVRKRHSAQDALTDAERRIRKGKGLVDEAAANFHTAATALITALNTSVQVLGTGVFEPPAPNLDQSRLPRPSMLRQAVDNELNGLYITAAYAAGVMQRTDQVGENLDEMMMFGGPEAGGPAGDFALADGPMSTSLANSYAFGDDPFSDGLLKREGTPDSDGSDSSTRPSSEDIGGAREQKVAELTGGHVPSGKPGTPGIKITQPGAGTSDIDVIGGDGSYIQVGGPAKAMNLAKLGHKLHILKWYAHQDGVPGRAYFSRGTPESALKLARKILGPENVTVFDE